MSDDMPLAGDIFHFSTASALGIKDTTGENMFWDFSNLTSLTYRDDTMLSKKDLPTAYQFLFSTSNLAERASQDISLDTTFSIKDVYNIYKNSSAKFEQTAFGGQLNGIPLPTYIKPTDVWYNFPLNYGDTSVSNSAYSISIPTIGYFSQKRVRETIVDGWGVLKTPIDTFSVLRVKSKLTDNDSINFFGIGIPAFTQISYEYKFLAKKKGLPVLQLNGSMVLGKMVFNTIIYQDTLRQIPTAINEVALLPVTSFPNPANQYIHVITDEGKLLMITDLSGRIIQQLRIEQNCSTVDTSTLPNGFYFLSVSNEEGQRITKKFVIQR